MLLFFLRIDILGSTVFRTRVVIMDEETARELAEFRASRIGRCFRLLQNKVWHTTSAPAFLAIVEDGRIQPNKGQLPYTWGNQSRNSYGGKRGYISLFDFRGVPPEKYGQCYFKWTCFFSKHQPLTLALEIDAEFLASGFISAESVRRSPEWNEFLIPHVEAWYNGDIPIRAVRSVLGFIDGLPPVPYETDDAALISLATLAAEPDNRETTEKNIP